MTEHIAVGQPLVMGGTGFIGTHIVQALLARGLPVRVLRRPTRISLRARTMPVTFVKATLDDADSLVRACDGCDTVFFAAGHYPRLSLDAAREVELARRGVRAALDAAVKSGVKRFILTSSAATIGPAPEGRAACETDVWRRPPRGSVYHRVKLAIEEEVLRAADRGLSAVVLCPSGCVGENDAKAGTGFFLVALGHGRLRYYIDGVTNMVDAAIVGQAHLRAAEVGRPGERYIIGGANVTIRELLELSAWEVGVPMRARRLPVALAAVLCKLDEMRVARTGRPRWLFAREFVDLVRFGQRLDSSRAIRELGIGATDLPATLRRALRWYEEHRYVPRRAAKAGRRKNGTGEIDDAA